MKFSFAHIRERSTTGGFIDFAVFDARASTGLDSDNAELLSQLTYAARSNGLKVDQSALAFMQNGRLRFYGSRNLVEYLSRSGLPPFNREIDIH